jgi:hypothetical protein
MTSFSVANDQALAQPSVMLVGVCKMVLPTKTVRLIDASVAARVGADLYEGSDPTFGSLYALSDFTDGAVNEAPSFTLTFAPASDAAAIALSSPAMQGSPLSLSLGILVPATGLFVDTPELILSGQLDYPVLRGEDNSRLLDLMITADTEQFFRGDDGTRLSDAWQQMRYPGETGLGQVSGILQQFWWGQSPLSGVSR